MISASLILVVAGIPLCLYRLWYRWYNECTCGGCGLIHRECVCAPPSSFGGSP
jgi:hypothetical protein